MNTIVWDRRHSSILTSICQRFKDENIRYFILRNYEGLPDINSSKDIDIIVDPSSVSLAKEILIDEYRRNGINYYYEVNYDRVYCCHGISNSLNLSIHIDLIANYVSKGYEVFTFEELYSNTVEYNGLIVMDKYFEGVMVFIYKQFNYKPFLKEEYRRIIYDTQKNFPSFRQLINDLVGFQLSGEINRSIEDNDFDRLVRLSPELTKGLRKFCFKKNPVKTINGILKFYLGKISRIVFRYRKYSKVFAVMAPDGAGKTTFIDGLIESINYYFVNDSQDSRCHVYHFRPNLLLNLGELGEIAKIKKQDTNFTSPHRSKPANFISSFFRICYYWFDYLVGFNYFVRKDVQFDKFSIFDRYSYDLIVDPLRTKIRLPRLIRTLISKLTPQPKIVFYLKAPTDVIYERKQELTVEEICRQKKEYEKISSTHNRFVTINSNQELNTSVGEAIDLILEKFTVKL
jgi:hypothetical protein